MESQILFLKPWERKEKKKVLNEVISQAPFQAWFHGFCGKDTHVAVKQRERSVESHLDVVTNLAMWLWGRHWILQNLNFFAWKITATILNSDGCYENSMRKRRLIHCLVHSRCWINLRFSSFFLHIGWFFPSGSQNLGCRGITQGAYWMRIPDLINEWWSSGICTFNKLTDEFPFRHYKPHFQKFCIVHYW